jgi:uncharacterized membrane protein
MTITIAPINSKALPDHVMQSGRWLALDIFRGLAAVLMVVNHIGVTFYHGDPSGGLDVWSIIIQLGSYAPVIFFTARSKLKCNTSTKSTN